jgi:hypothetical protein
VTVWRDLSELAGEKSCPARKKKIKAVESFKSASRVAIASSVE